MKKILLSLLLLIGLTGCTAAKLTFKEVPEGVEVLRKYTTVEETYDFWFDELRVYTAYHLVLDNGDTIDVDIDTYNKYDVKENNEDN